MNARHPTLARRSDMRSVLQTACLTLSPACDTKAVLRHFEPSVLPGPHNYITALKFFLAKAKMATSHLAPEFRVGLTLRLALMARLLGFG